MNPSSSHISLIAELPVSLSNGVSSDDEKEVVDRAASIGLSPTRPHTDKDSVFFGENPRSVANGGAPEDEGGDATGDEGGDATGDDSSPEDPSPQAFIIFPDGDSAIIYPAPPVDASVFLKHGEVFFNEDETTPEDPEMEKCIETVSPEGTRYYYPLSIAGKVDDVAEATSDEEPPSDSEEERVGEDTVLQEGDTIAIATSAQRSDLAGSDDALQTAIGKDSNFDVSDLICDDCVSEIKMENPCLEECLDGKNDSGIFTAIGSDSKANKTTGFETGLATVDNKIKGGNFFDVNDISDDGTESKTVMFNTGLMLETLQSTPSLQEDKNISVAAGQSAVVTEKAVGSPAGMVTATVKGSEAPVKQGVGKEGVEELPGVELLNAVVDPCLDEVINKESNGEKVEPVGKSGLVCLQVPRSWANVVRGPETPMGHPGVEESKRFPKMMKLSLKDPIVKEDGSSMIKIPKEVANKGIEIWKHTLVGYFYDKPPPHRLIRECANNLWARFGFYKMTPYENGLFLFQFQDEKGLELVMERGPWTIHRFPLFLKKWSPNEDCLKESFKTIPVWVKFYGIPLKYWSEEGLSHVASSIGTPIHADHITAERDRIDFARICIDFNVESTFPSTVFIEEEDGPGFMVKLEYSWTPKVCEKCKLFGHRAMSCTNVVEKVWVPKDVSEQVRKDDGKVVGSRGIESSSRPHLINAMGSTSSKKDDRSLGRKVETMAPIGRQAQSPMFSGKKGVHQIPPRGTTNPPLPLVSNGDAKQEAPFIFPSDCLRPRYTSVGMRKSSVEVSNPFAHLEAVEDDLDDDDYDDLSPRTSGLANTMDSREKNRKKLKCLRSLC